eukprot:TRINITY_DN36826_c0_g4_i1.p1 TRINITY_DN36826_c0_g4~~TRINITY_DN36826_c0_g4_i1.p1  ORF type:complete len:285 (+),score=68.96 TRINITY_DN36826_c0_g4_i1:67-921(+)
MSLDDACPSLAEVLAALDREEEDCEDGAGSDESSNGEEAGAAIPALAEVLARLDEQEGPQNYVTEHASGKERAEDHAVARSRTPDEPPTGLPAAGVEDEDDDDDDDLAPLDEMLLQLDQEDGSDAAATQAVVADVPWGLPPVVQSDGLPGTSCGSDSDEDGILPLDEMLDQLEDETEVRPLESLLADMEEAEHAEEAEQSWSEFRNLGGGTNGDDTADGQTSNGPTAAGQDEDLETVYAVRQRDLSTVQMRSAQRFDKFRRPQWRRTRGKQPPSATLPLGETPL